MPADSRVDLPRLYECMDENATLCAAKVRAYVYMTLLAICERGVSPHPAVKNARPVTFEFAEQTLALCDSLLATTATLDRTSAVQSARALLGMGCEAPDDDNQLDPVLQTYFDRQLIEVTVQCGKLREVVAALMTIPPSGTPLS